MAIYNSMIIWITVMSLINRMFATRNKIGAQNNTFRRVSKVSAFITFGYIAFWAAVRSGVADTAAYISMFRNAPSNIGAIFQYWNVQEKAPGFKTLQVLVKHFTSNYHIWLTLITIVCCYPISRSLRRYSEDYFVSTYLFITTLCFFWLYNGIRQFIVAAIVFGRIDLIIERKTKEFLLLIAILSTIHFTAWIWIPVYFFVTEKPFGKKMMLFTVAIMLAAIFTGSFVSAMDDVLSGSAYADYSSQFAYDDGVNLIRVAVYMVPVIISFVYRNQLEWKNEPLIAVCMNLSLISAGIYFVGVFTSGILIGRLPIYFELFNLILFPYMINHFIPNSGKRVTRFLLITGYFMYYYIQMRNSYYISEITGLVY